MLWHLAFLYWMILDPIGTVPIFVSHLSHLPPRRQTFVILREMVIGLIVMIFTLFFGQEFFKLLTVDEGGLATTGGIIVFLIGVKMIFAKPISDALSVIPKREPLITPIAIPIIAGPGILTAIILYSGDLISNLTVLFAILIAWGCSLPIVMLSPQIKRYIGPNGAAAVERIFGFIVILIAVQMFLSGIITHFKL